MLQLLIGENLFKVLIRCERGFCKIAYSNLWIKSMIFYFLLQGWCLSVNLGYLTATDFWQIFLKILREGVYRRG
ncbi:hypothetical protein EIR98_00740 [Salmonella enterica]|nr:hypothetical protein [Salmonella enterica]EBJ4235267.1 hypothetical protein [Salmonella enterica]EBN1550570.1 hypothetical protein [Salmonella enterica]HAD4753650.1 hypothetical protein [Salmonella enterica subsp. enterica serovar Typhi str. CT18]